MTRKIINIIIAILFIYILGTSALYFTTQKDVAHWEAETTKMAKNEANLKNVRRFYVFTTDKTYYTVEGNNKNNEKIYFTYSPDTKKKTQTKADKLVNHENALSLARHNLPDATVKEANIGLEDGEYVWEVSFRDKNGALGYHYIDASDAQWYETINNL
ncbi:cell wall elongation regulator TseB-like domain-containing protein [Aerococcus suis]|uniref:Uncharacterized protein YpmB n=1 Tax=Aerococcus suis TaxID=371602 RepID=A0A1W1YND6_9LACT|nr:DUF5590 domain-containing protein [Aerococcus suis]MCI7240142.1 DUF5590 domain-containing protein [Aerococcus suis]MDD7758254.1 DUF5590 domain-containing protein [Aerococcus suis]MDY4646659.1 DUF5590 domain-containing protein [Aerococcus suis]SMC37646.1 Uncharacterized protein YpmB [Aerococcus suis]